MEDINRLKEEIDNLSKELSTIHKENDKRERIKNIKVFMRRVEKYSSYLLLTTYTVVSKLTGDIDMNNIPIPVPKFLTNTGNNFILVSAEFLIFFIVYYGLCRSKIQTGIEDYCNVMIEDIKHRYPSISDKEIVRVLREKESEYYHLLRENNIPQK